MIGITNTLADFNNTISERLWLAIGMTNAGGNQAHGRRFSWLRCESWPIIWDLEVGAVPRDGRPVPATLSLPVLSLQELVPALGAHRIELGLPPRIFSDSLDHPKGAGVYVWCAQPDDAVAYIGSAANLARRVGNERSWVDVHEPESGWAPTVVHMLKHLEAKPHWVEVDSHEEALLLERRLIEWHRAVVGTAPLLVGWAPAKNSPQAKANSWAHDVWNTNPELYRIWGA